MTSNFEPIPQTRDQLITRTKKLLSLLEDKTLSDPQLGEAELIIAELNLGFGLFKIEILSGEALSSKERGWFRRA